MTTLTTDPATTYEAGAEEVLPLLERLPRVATTSGDGEDRAVGEYYDADGFPLISAGVRLWADGETGRWHLSMPPVDGGAYKTEAPADGGQVPPQLLSLVRVHTRGRELRPVARITTTRTHRTLLDDRGRPLAEAIVDKVSAQTFGDSTTISQWHHLELRPAANARKWAGEAEKRLRRSGLRPDRHQAELLRALDGQVPGTRPGPKARPLTRRSTAGEVVLTALQQHANRLKLLDPLVRRAEPDSVHQMRVTARRLRSTLQSFGMIVDAAGTRRLASELRWLGTVLGGERDSEMLAARVEAHVRATPAELLLGAVQARVRTYFAPVQAASRSAVMNALDSPRYLALLDLLDGVLAAPPLTAAAARAAARVLPGAVGRDYRRLRRRIRRAAEAAPGEGRDTALHNARKAAKRARYAAETVSPVFGKHARRFAVRMKRVQAALGDHHDAIIARATIRDMGVAAHLARDNAFSFGLFHERESECARRSEGRGWHAWDRGSRRKYRTWL
jgi:CHAD domain-containing protein